MSAVVLWLLTGTKRSLDVFVGMTVVRLLSGLRKFWPVDKQEFTHTLRFKALPPIRQNKHCSPWDQGKQATALLELVLYQLAQPAAPDGQSLARGNFQGYRCCGSILSLV